MRILLIGFVVLCLISKSFFGIEVVSTIVPLHNIVSEVTRGVVESRVIISGVSEHDYQLLPRDVKLLKDADLVFYISDELETFVGRMRDKQWVELFPLVPKPLTRGDGRRDVHIWLDLENVKAIVDVVTQKLTEKDSEHAVLYTKNADAFKGRIDALADQLRSSLAELPDKPYLAMHNAYQYFYKYFNVPAPILLNENEHFNFKEVQKLNNMIKEKYLSCLIVDPYHELPLSMKFKKNVKQVLVDPLGVKDQSYTEFISVVASGWFKCLL